MSGGQKQEASVFRGKNITVIDWILVEESEWEEIAKGQNNEGRKKEVETLNSS